MGSCASRSSGSASDKKEAVLEYGDSDLRIYSDGRVDRKPWDSCDIVPACPSPSDPDDVASKDLLLNAHHSTNLRLFLPPSHSSKLPILLYFHGGNFTHYITALSAFHGYLSRLAIHCSALIVSVDYRLAPEHPLPAAYEDCYEALLWLEKQAAMAASGDASVEPWLATSADFSRCFLIGDSAGGTIVHNVAMQALGHGAWDSQQEKRILKNVAMQGLLLCHPWFTCSSSEMNPQAPGDAMILKYTKTHVDSPLVNPFSASAPPLEGVALPRAIVFVAGRDRLKDRGTAYYEGLMRAGKETKLSCTDEGIHIFHILQPWSPNVAPFLKQVNDFIRTTSVNV
ncbi:hypothetical protein KP509_36G023800 [Ceratopteris richardii]|uniref:Alpha/beta hydrolase fold-3 domain-containing protein n=1 Tax=Ceratopteris richardii TaxID=49495 RepID=A0A8T2QAZ1_CERRI|nr:hypothetical protein KP509_36G023800 [Ceratopteris richardii]